MIPRFGRIIFNALHEKELPLVMLASAQAGAGTCDALSATASYPYRKADKRLNASPYFSHNLRWFTGATTDHSTVRAQRRKRTESMIRFPRGSRRL